MIRMYEYEPRVDEQGNAVAAYRDFQNYLFSQPYGFLWDFQKDKVTIYGTAYRISSLQLVPVVNQVTCLCLCGGSGNGNSGGTGKINTDESLHGEGSEADPLGVQPSKKAGNRLQILEDGCYVGPEAELPDPIIFAGVSRSMDITPSEIISGQENKITGSGITITYNSFSQEYIWMACPQDMQLQSASDENGFSIIAAFKPSTSRLVLSGKETGYHLYVFDTPATGDNYRVTYNF